MTSPVAIVALTYAAVDIQLADLSIFLTIRRGLNESPTVRGKDVTVPYLAGRSSRPRRNDILAIELVGMVQPDADQVTPAAQSASWRDNQRTVRALFASNRDPAALVATLENGDTATISARPLSGAIWEEEIEGLVATVSIPLEGYDDWVIDTAVTPATAALTLSTFAPTVT